MTVLVIGAPERAALQQLHQAAARAPVDMAVLAQAFAGPDNPARQAHRAQMNAQTVLLPAAFFCTFSIELGHPVGVCRHMSMSVGREGRIPRPEAVWMVAEELGFVAGIEACKVWMEDLSDGGKAVNLVQPVTVARP